MFTIFIFKTVQWDWLFCYLISNNCEKLKIKIELVLKTVLKIYVHCRKAQDSSKEEHCSYVSSDDEQNQIRNVLRKIVSTTWPSIAAIIILHTLRLSWDKNLLGRWALVTMKVLNRNCLHLRKNFRGLSRCTSKLYTADPSTVTEML